MRRFQTFSLLVYLCVLRETANGRTINVNNFLFKMKYLGTIFGIRIVDAPESRDRPQYQPQYKPQYKPNIIDGFSNLKAGALRTGANALRFKVRRVNNMSVVFSKSTVKTTKC